MAFLVNIHADIVIAKLWGQSSHNSPEEKTEGEKPEMVAEHCCTHLIGDRIKLKFALQRHVIQFWKALIFLISEM